MSNPHPNTILFARGTLARLTLWPALRLAVHASWGGPESAQKQRWLAGVLVDQFESFIVDSSSTTSTTPVPTSTPAVNEPPPDDAYVEELLLQIMVDEFEVTLEDESAGAVARDVVRLFESTRTGDDRFVKTLEEQAEKVKGKVPTYERGAGSGSDEDESGSSEGEWEDEEQIESDGESVPQLLNRAEPQTREEPQVDEDGFTMIKRKGCR
ncbi:Pre-rRNA-processing protein TSR2-domain-containing protein [Chiua virens]|nr:Pre-rRNA-processing protein TSR2-domain-containing protein [Chiua virens]